MMNPVPWLQMTNMISYQGLVRTFPSGVKGIPFRYPFYNNQKKSIRVLIPTVRPILTCATALLPFM
ncbi:hypothetical protein D2182_26035 [Escherichia coli]|nr:hypothetical protein D2182_26035 [Escherichia coli]